MRAAYYSKQGPAREVLRIGELPTPQPVLAAARLVPARQMTDSGASAAYYGQPKAMRPQPVAGHVVEPVPPQCR